MTNSVSARPYPRKPATSMFSRRTEFLVCTGPWLSCDLIRDTADGTLLSVQVAGLPSRGTALDVLANILVHGVSVPRRLARKAMPSRDGR